MSDSIPFTRQMVGYEFSPNTPGIELIRWVSCRSPIGDLDQLLKDLFPPQELSADEPLIVEAPDA